jgi:hypothetical protein
MDKQNSLFDNEYSEYFDLFQKQTEYSSKILENAKKIKQSIQEIYKDINFLTQEIDADAWIFDFDVILTQVSEQPEPNALKLFTRQYTPVVKVYKNNSLASTIIFDTETKYIHKHINELFVGESVSQEYFFDVAQQYFLLDFVYRQIKNENFTKTFVSKVKESCNDYEPTNKNIICVNCKLQGRNMPDKINPNIHSVISHINTRWSILSKQTTFSIIGNYKNYLNEDELIKQLNDKESEFISETISDYFQNDCLLLNNMEFLNEKPYTTDWNDRIFAPILLEKKEDKYCLKNIDSIKKINKQIFLFQKIKPDGMFYKTEIYIPDKDMTQDNFIKIVSLSMQLLKFKQQEER